MTNIFEDLGFPPDEAAALLDKSQKFNLLQELLKKRLQDRNLFRKHGVTAEEMLDILAGSLSKFTIKRIDEISEIIWKNK